MFSLHLSPGGNISVSGGSSQHSQRMRQIFLTSHVKLSWVRLINREHEHGLTPISWARGFTQGLIKVTGQRCKHSVTHLTTCHLFCISWRTRPHSRVDTKQIWDICRDSVSFTLNPYPFTNFLNLTSLVSKLLNPLCPPTHLIQGDIFNTFWLLWFFGQQNRFHFRWLTNFQKRLLNS